ncbi:hypothetical protein H0H92_001434 [Tricholoma furcatifolium]|nr:hypothetical protein H0H92_001434 [Tricholoma furcatifolium]
MSGTQKALVLESKFGDYKLKEQPIHEPSPGELLVKVEVVGLNPVDWKIPAYGFDLPYPIVVGSDVTGVVEKLGNGVSGFAVGDRVSVASKSAVLDDTDRGRHTASSREYALTYAETTAKIPPRISFEEAATIPATITSGFCGLYLARPHGVGLTPPLDVSARGKYAGRPLVVLGASSNVGQNVLQLAKLSGFSPIVVTASPKNTEHLKSIGATHVIDRNASPAAQAEEIRKIIPGPIDIVYDSVSFPETQKLGYSLIADAGFLILVLPPTEGVKTTAEKTVINFQGFWSLPHTRPLGIQFYSKFTELLDQGLIKPNRYEVVPGGLNGVSKGLERLKANEVSGTKLVIRVRETV